MSMTRDQIKAEAMALDPREREQLAEELWRSVDEATKDEIDAAWAAEIRRRIEAVDSSQMPTVPADEVFAKLRSRLQQ